MGTFLFIVFERARLSDFNTAQRLNNSDVLCVCVFANKVKNKAFA